MKGAYMKHLGLSDFTSKYTPLARGIRQISDSMKFPAYVCVFTLHILLRGFQKSIRLTVLITSFAYSYHLNDYVAAFISILGYFISNRLKIPVITGTIGSGKSTSIAYIRKRYPSFRIIDADVVAREIVAKGTRAHAEIVALFGHSILLPSGELDRKEIANIVFAQPEKRIALNRITHWRVFLQIVTFAFVESVIKGNQVIADIPLFFESPIFFRFLFYPKILIFSSPEETVERVKLRNPDESENVIRGRMNSQLPPEVKMKMADFIFRNDGDLSHLYRQIDDLFSQIF